MSGLLKRTGKKAPRESTTPVPTDGRVDKKAPRESTPVGESQ